MGHDRDASAFPSPQREQPTMTSQGEQEWRRSNNKHDDDDDDTTTTTKARKGEKESQTSSTNED